MRKNPKPALITVLTLLTLTASYLLISSYPTFASSPTVPEQEDTAVEAGRIIFEETAGGVGCAVCHGHFALGDVGTGPYIRGVSEQTIREALDTVADMDFLSLTDDEIQGVAAYLDWLGGLEARKTNFKRGEFIPAELHVPAGKEVQLIIVNSDRSDRSFGSPELGLDEFKVAARGFSDLLWTTPTEEGTYFLRCIECGGQLPLLVIHIDAGE